MDWLLYSQFLGKFRNLRDADNTLSENNNRVFERDGIISEETIGVPTNLAERQAIIFNIGTVCLNIPAFPRSDAWLAY